jgi:phage terminase large subunit-like protein
VAASAVEMAALEELADLTGALVESATTDLLPWIRWTPKQDEWLRLNPPTGVKLLRGPNQAIGKTWAQMQEVNWRAEGTHPHYPTRAPPVEIWVVCTSWAQSVAIQRKFWTLANKSSLTLRTREHYTNRNGWGKDNPTAEFINGSLVRFRTTNQGAEALAGATIDYVAIDEPPDEEVFRELRKRVERRGGHVGMSLTPINRPCGWLREMVEAGQIDEVHARLEAKNLVPIGSTEPLRLDDGTVMDQEWIDWQRHITPAMWAPVILDGEWETRPEGVFFKCFDAKKHGLGMRFDPTRRDTKTGQVVPIRRVLGIDYATADRPYGHTAALCEVQQYRDAKGRLREAVVVIDEVAVDGTATDEQFVIEVVAMLARHDLRWSDLFAVHGDNPARGRFIEKSNLNTTKALARELGVAIRAVSPAILNAKDDVASGGSFDTSCQWVYERVAAGFFQVHPRCKLITKAFETWDYSRMHPLKDVLDAVRYALKPWIFPANRATGATVVFHGARG